MQSDSTVHIPLRARNGTVRAFALIDAADAPFVNQWRWCLGKRGYAVRGERNDGQRRTPYLHREILGLGGGDMRVVDHINRDKLDCRRANMRVITRAGNAQNLGSKPGSSSVARGVTWDPITRKWRAEIRVGGRRHRLGRFVTEADAAEAARSARAKLMPYAVD